MSVKSLNANCIVCLCEHTTASLVIGVFFREAVSTHEDIDTKKRNRSTWCKVRNHEVHLVQGKISCGGCMVRNEMDHLVQGN